MEYLPTLHYQACLTRTLPCSCRYAILHLGKDVENKPWPTEPRWLLLASTSANPESSDLQDYKQRYPLHKFPRDKGFNKNAIRSAVLVEPPSDGFISSWTDLRWNHRWYIKSIVLFDEVVRNVTCPQGKPSSWKLQDPDGVVTTFLLKQIIAGRVVFCST